MNSQTALPRVKLSAKITVAGCKMNCIMYSNGFQSGAPVAGHEVS